MGRVRALGVGGVPINGIWNLRNVPLIDDFFFSCILSPQWKTAQYSITLHTQWSLVGLLIDELMCALWLMGFCIQIFFFCWQPNLPINLERSFLGHLWVTLATLSPYPFPQMLQVLSTSSNLLGLHIHTHPVPCCLNTLHIWLVTSVGKTASIIHINLVSLLCASLWAYYVCSWLAVIRFMFYFYLLGMFLEIQGLSDILFIWSTPGIVFQTEMFQNISWKEWLIGLALLDGVSGRGFMEVIK